MAVSGPFLFLAAKQTRQTRLFVEEEEGYKGCSSSYAAKGPQFLRDTAGKGRDRPSKANPQESLLRTLSVPRLFVEPW